MNPRVWRVRPAVAALPAALLVSLLCRSIVHGVGADELSLLTMGQSIRAGFLPFERYWDVRPPLAYLWALPSAYAEDAARAVVTLRWLAWLAQAGAAWIFFCLFRRTLGAGPAALGGFGLILAANATPLHMMAMPNNFSMAASVAAFACLVAGRRQRPVAFVCSGLLAGLMPWLMVHAALATLALGALALCSRSCSWRLRLWWLAAAALPGVATLGVYVVWGALDALLRTVLGGPLGVLEMRAGGGYQLFSAAQLLEFFTAAPWAVFHVAVLVAGLACLPVALRRAPVGSALRLSPFLAAPLLLGYAVLAYAKPPGPPEYVVDAAPALGLAVAVAASMALSWRGWIRPGVVRQVRPAVLRWCLLASSAALLALPFDPWSQPAKPLPETYCEATTYWLQRLAPASTVLNTTGLCGFHLLDQGATLHPPFTFPPMWLRQLTQPWVGAALGDGGDGAAAARRLQGALAADSGAGMILADGRLLQEIRQRGWQREVHAQWRMAWFRRVAGIDPGEQFARLAILVRRPVAE